MKQGITIFLLTATMLFIGKGNGICAAPAGQESGEDIQSRSQKSLSDLENAADFAFGRSAALSWFRRNYSYTELNGKMEWRDEQDAYEPAAGEGNLQGSFNVDSYLRMGEKPVVFGGAEYVTGEKKNVCWNSTSDYRLLYPYLLADSIGGNLRHEQYRFYGGYARVDGRFTYGLTASYRALQEYRQTDPRPRNITGDISADISAGYLFGRYAAGLSAGVRIYKQQQSVEFYDANGANTSELHFTGLGTYYSRYSGTTYTSVRYRGSGWNASLAVVPKNGEGWYAMAGYVYMKTDHRLAMINMATLTSLETRDASIGIAWRKSSERFGWALSATGRYEHRSGDENIMGSGSSPDHHPLQGQPMYKSDAGEFDIEAILEWKVRNGTWNLRPHAGICFDLEKYAYPERSMELSYASAGIATKYLRHNGKWLWSIGAAGDFSANTGGKFNIPQKQTDERIYAYISHLYSRHSENAAIIELDMRVQRKISENMAVFLSAREYVRLFEKGWKENLMQVAIGICF